MNRAFVNEDALAAAQTTPERPLSDKPNYVTTDGLAELRGRLAGIEAQIRQLQPERPDHELTAEALARDRRYLLARIASAIPVTPPPRPQQVSFGCRVSIHDADGGRSVQIVGEDEADVAAGRIAWTSPLARALQSAKIGETVIWERPVGALEIEIIAIDGS